MTEAHNREQVGEEPATHDWPLAGVRVVDLSRVLSGPSCAKALADLGADVIKVEPPEGDLTRTAQPRAGGIPVYFAQQNCGKRCISVDLATPKGRELILRLVRVSDVVVENFRPGVLERLGLGYEQARAINPALIYCSVSGYGQDGPSANRRAYAPVMHAELGLMELTARPSPWPRRSLTPTSMRASRPRSQFWPHSVSVTAPAGVSMWTCRWPRPCCKPWS